MKRAIFRADGSSSIGMGHIMRCMALAAGLNGLNVQSLFVTRAFDPQITNVIRSNGLDVEEIPEESTIETDMQLTREIAVDRGAQLIVTDLCHRQTLTDPEGLTSYHKSLASEFFLVSFTDDELPEFPVDIVVLPYVGLAEKKCVAPSRQVSLLGPSFFIFRPEFITAAKAPRTISRQGNRLLVTIGGSDQLHLTRTILEAACTITAPFFDLKVVLGAGYSDQLRSEVAGILQRYGGRYELLEQQANMAEAMLWSDLAIIGDGLTKYEAAVTGTPSIMICRPDRKSPLNWEFALKESTLYLGYERALETADIAQNVRRLMGDATLRAKMSERGKGLVDGRGLERIIACIPEGVFQ